MSMMTLTPTQWNGNSISTGAYRSKFHVSSGLDQMAGVETILSESLSGRPQYQGRRFTERRLVLRVQIVTQTQANYEQLMAWFDPADGEKTLTCTAVDSSTRRLKAKCESRRAVENAEWLYEFTLVTAEGQFSKTPGTSPLVWTVASSGSTQVVNNGGTTRSYPVIKIKAAVAKSAANGWTYRRFCNIANGAEAPLTSPMGSLGYPLLLFDGAVNYTGKLVAGFEDFRVFVDGREWQRYDSSVFGDTISSLKHWIPITFSAPVRWARFNSSSIIMPANQNTVAAIASYTSIADWPDSGYVMFDNEVVWYESHDDFHIYNVHRAMLNTAAATHPTLSFYRPVQEHVIEAWYNYTGAPDDFDYELDDFSCDTLNLSTSTNTSHIIEKYWARKTRRARQWVPELIEVNDYDALISLKDSTVITGNSDIKFRDTPGQFKKNTMTLDCPVPIDAAAAAITHDVTVPVTLALKTVGQDLTGNDVELATYYSADSGTGKTITPTVPLKQLRYEVHNQIVTGGLGTGTDTLVTSATPYAQIFTLDEDTTIRAIMYRHKRASGSDTLALDLYAVNDDDEESVDTSTKLMPTTAPASYNTSYVDEVESLPVAIKVSSGKYALVWTCSGSTGINIDTSDGSTYANGELRSGGVQTLTISASYDVKVDSSGGKSTVDPMEIYGPDSVFPPPKRVALRFDAPANFPDSPTISSAILRFYVENVGAAGTLSVRRYAGDPEADAGSTVYANAVTGTSYFSGSTAGFTGSATNDVALGASAYTDIPTDMGNNEFFSLGMSMNLGNWFWFSAIADASNPEAKLIVTYSESASSAYTTKVGRDAYFLILGEALNQPQGDAPEGQALELIIENTELDYDAFSAGGSSGAPKFINSTEETSGVVLIYNATLTNGATGQTITIKIPCTVGDEFEIDCENKTVRRVTAAQTAASRNGYVENEHIPWACTFSDDEEWMYLAPGSNTFTWTEAGMAVNGIIVTFTWEDKFT